MAAEASGTPDVTSETGDVAGAPEPVPPSGTPSETASESTASEPATSETATSEPASEPEGVQVSPGLRQLILAGAVVSTGATVLGTALLPYLLVKHPALLLLSSADGRNLVLMAPVLDLPVVLGIAIPRRIFSMLVVYGLGMLYGRAMLAWSNEKLPMLGRGLAWLERTFLRFRRTVLVLWPTYTTSVIAGIGHVGLRAFLPWMILGQLFYVLISFFLGDAISAFTDRLIAAVSRNLWETTAVFVGLVSVQQLVSYARRRRVTGRATETRIG